MSSLVKNRAGTWELYYRCMPGCDAHPEGGTRHHVSLGTRDTKVAHQLQEEFDAEQDLLVARLKLGLATLKPKASLTLSALWKQYAEAMAHEKSPYTLSDADWPAINHLIMHVGDIQASQLTLPTVLQYRAKFLTVLKLAPATWNSRRKILRAIWNWAIRMKFLTTNPFSEVNDVVDHEDDHRLQPVPTHQLRALLAMAPSRFWQLIILFLYQTMCRRGELINLLRTDVLWNEDLIRFRRPKERRGSQVRHKYISLTPELKLIIREAQRLSESAYVFSTAQREGRPMSGRKITRMLQKIGKRAGVTVSPHRLRKSGATDTTTNGTDLKTLQEILGHSDIRTTAKYVRPNPVHQAQAMRRLKVGPLLQVANKRSTPSHPQPRAQTLRSKAKRKTPLKKTKGHPGRSART